MVLVIATKAQELLNYDARKIRRKSLVECEAQLKTGSSNQWKGRTRRLSPPVTNRLHGSFIQKRQIKQSFKSNIQSLRVYRKNNKILETLETHSVLKWSNRSTNTSFSGRSRCNITKKFADNILGKAIAVTRNSTKTPNTHRSNKNNENNIYNAGNDDGSYLSISTPYSIVRLYFTRKRRLHKRRKRKYFMHKQPPPLIPQATATSAMSAISPTTITTKTQTSSTISISTAIKPLLSTLSLTSSSSLSLPASTVLNCIEKSSALEKFHKSKITKNCKVTYINDRILTTQKINFNNRRQNKQQPQQQQEQQHPYEYQQNSSLLSSSKKFTSNMAIHCGKISTSLAAQRIPMQLHLFSAYYALTIFRLFLTTLTTFAASTTNTLVSIASTCFATSSAAAMTIIAFLTLMQQQLHCCCCSAAINNTRSIVNMVYGDRKTSCNSLAISYRYCSNRFLNGLNKYSWIFLLIYLNLSAKVCLAGYHEKRLLHDLLDPYNTLERPVLNESDPLQLSFGLTLMQIIDVDEKNQLLVTNVWLKLEWNDMNLRWNTSDYGGVKDLRIPPHRIWKPDVLMYNSADEGFDGTYQTNVVVRNNGSCLYVPPGIFKSTCKIDITWFPFDDQRCEMKFGSWTYDGFQLDLQLQDETGGDISSYVLNGEWELLGVPGKRNEIYYNCCPEPYIDITFTIIIRRRTLYYFFNLIIPCVLIASMALLGFTLPPDSGEKLSLGVTILLSLTVFLNMVAETMPATSDAVPLLGTYFNCIMFMVASSVVSTILILNYHHRNADTHEMSEWIRIVFLCWLPWILRMSRPGRPLILEFPTTPCSDSSSERKHQILSDVELKERSSKSLLANVLDIDDDFRHNCRPMTPGGTLPQNPPFYRTVYGQGDEGSLGGPIGGARMPDAVSHHTCIKTATEYELGLILKEIRFITDQLRKEDEDNDIANDWKFAAMVVDRLCLIIFTMFTILATIAVLLSAPHIIVS